MYNLITVISAKKVINGLRVAQITNNGSKPLYQVFFDNVALIGSKETANKKEALKLMIDLQKHRTLFLAK